MALTDYKIVEGDYTGKDIAALANRPALSAAALKARFDSLVKNVVRVKHNGLIDALVTAIDGIGATISGLAKKVTGGTTGNLAALDANGDIADSGKNAANFEAAGAVGTHNTNNGAHGGHLTNTNNPHSTTAAQAGALPLSGGTMTGDVQLKYGASHLGKSRITKNHSAITDWGTYILDYKSGEADADRRGIRICASGQTDNPLEYMEGTTPHQILTAKSPVSVSQGGTGQTTVAAARNAWGLGNTDGAVPIANGGTGTTTASGARQAFGVQVYSGNVYVEAGTNVGTYSISGATTSWKYVAVRADSIGGTGTAAIVGACVAVSGGVQIRFLYSFSSAQNIPVFIIAITN